MQDAKEEVRARLNIEDIIGEYVQLKRAGRNFKGLSPFSGEKTASFFVSPDKHIWHDFSSNKGGDIFAFVMEVEGMDFRQSLEHLARKAGVDLSIYSSKGSGEIAAKKRRLGEAHDLAAKYYQQSLLSNQHAIEYVFKKRGLSKEIVQDFRIGYAPTAGDALVQFLLRKQFTRRELDDGGLTNRFGSDMFRGRMTVPLMDGTGQVIGFTARIIADDPKAPKYLNTTQTLLYDKSRHVFGLSQAKEAIRKNDYAVIVEGNLDVVSSHQVGIKQVVATAGTAMTEHHLRALSRLSGNMRLAFDGDKAGLAATERAIPIAQAVGVDLKIITLPGEAKDPDELIQQDPKLWQQAIDTAQPVVDWVLDQYSQREDMSSASGKRAFTTAGLAVIRALSDPIEKEHYLKKIATMADSSLSALSQKIAQSKAEPTKELRQVARTSESGPYKSHARNQDILLAVALRDPHIQDMLKSIDPLQFMDASRQNVATYLKGHIGHAVESVPGELHEDEKYVTMLLLHPDVDKLEWRENNRINTAADVLRSLQSNYQKNETKEELLRQESIARNDGNDELANELLMKINRIIRGEK
ncbi:MAG: DNA primase [Chloroflexi bacterium]|nr:MAG: DNA primase [Chloroflexota bacterium]